MKISTKAIKQAILILKHHANSHGSINRKTLRNIRSRDIAIYRFLNNR